MAVSLSPDCEIGVTWRVTECDKSEKVQLPAISGLQPEKARSVLSHADGAEMQHPVGLFSGSHRVGHQHQCCPVGTALGH